jgi:tRNA (adenine37-N6)-methyltransferase
LRIAGTGIGKRFGKGEETGKTYAVWLHDFNVRWRVTDAGFEVFALEPR